MAVLLKSSHRSFAASSSKRGSVMILSLIMAAVFSITLGGLIQYSRHANLSAKRDSIRELALHLAESGAEMGIHALQTGQDSNGFWKKDTNNFYEIGNYTAELDVGVIPNSSDDSLYDIYAVVTIPFGNSSLRRAVSVTVQASNSDEASDDGDPLTGRFPYAIIAREEININHGNNDKRPRFASYNSNYVTDPKFGEDTGFAAALVTPNSRNNAITANNAIIHGILNSGGGNVRYDSGRNNPNQLDQNLWLSMSEEDYQDNPYGINTDGIQNSFNGEVNDPEYPDVTGYEAPNGQSEITKDTFWNANNNQINFGVDQNFWQNGQNAGSTDLISTSGNTRTIGKSGGRSVLATPSINLQNGAKLVVKGDVVLYVKRGFNIQGDIEFEDGASLHLIAEENNHFTGSTNNPKPIQFRVTPYVDTESNRPSGPNVQFNNTNRIAMVIDAPYSPVSTGGQGNGTFNYLGAVVAKSFQSPNGVYFFYDITLSEGAGEDDDDDIFDDDSATNFEVVEWSERPLTDVVVLLTTWGVDV